MASIFLTETLSQKGKKKESSLSLWMEMLQSTLGDFWIKKNAQVNIGYNYHHLSSLRIHTFHIPLKTGKKNPQWDVFQQTNLANESEYQ